MKQDTGEGMITEEEVRNRYDAGQLSKVSVLSLFTLFSINCPFLLLGRRHSSIIHHLSNLLATIRFNSVFPFPLLSTS